MTIQLFRLVMRAGPLPGQVYDLAAGEITIGRGSTNDIIINDVEVSRNHARLYQQAGGYVIEDLGSTNGTYINGQRLMGPHMLRAGEAIYLGEKVGLEVEAVYDDDATIVPQPAVPADQSPKPDAAPPIPQTAAPQTIPSQEMAAQEPLEPDPAPVFTPVQAQPAQPPAPQPAPQPVPQPVPQTVPPPTPAAQPVVVESDQYAPDAVQYTDEEERVPINWNWVFAGCGCMSIIVFGLIVAALFWVDSGGVDRWCQFLGFLFPTCP